MNDDPGRMEETFMAYLCPFFDLELLNSFLKMLFSSLLKFESSLLYNKALANTL
jgi:hypothetical protein